MMVCSSKSHLNQDVDPFCLSLGVRAKIILLSERSTLANRVPRDTHEQLTMMINDH